MDNGSKKRFFAYLLWAFLLAWILQVTAGVLYRKGNLAAYSPVLAAVSG